MNAVLVVLSLLGVLASCALGLVVIVVAALWLDHLAQLTAALAPQVVDEAASRLAWAVPRPRLSRDGRGTVLRDTRRRPPRVLPCPPPVVALPRRVEHPPRGVRS